jgi:hypothetical protein
MRPAPAKRRLAGPDSGAVVWAGVPAVQKLASTCSLTQSGRTEQSSPLASRSPAAPSATTSLLRRAPPRGRVPIGKVPPLDPGEPPSYLWFPQCPQPQIGRPRRLQFASSVGPGAESPLPLPVGAEKGNGRADAPGAEKLRAAWLSTSRSWILLPPG